MRLQDWSERWSGFGIVEYVMWKSSSFGSIEDDLSFIVEFLLL